MVKRKVQFPKVKDHLFYIKIFIDIYLFKNNKDYGFLKKKNFFTKKCGPFLIIETGPQVRLAILLKKYSVITYKASINTSQNIVTQRVKKYLLCSIISLNFEIAFRELERRDIYQQTKLEKIHRNPSPSPNTILSSTWFRL